MTEPPESRFPNPVDLHVGARIRMRRRMQGVSQERLAESLGLTFQQVQKYERGANRVSASKLYEIASTLHAPVAYFFDGLSDPAGDGDEESDGGADEQTVHAFLMTGEGLELARCFTRIPRGRVRRRFLELIRALAGDEVDEPEDAAA
jgi:transcriptional regulator with XRE-family HTH domain